MDPPIPEIAALSLVESSKRAAAYRAVDEHYPASAKVIGIGSGSTVVYVVERIAQLPRDKTDGVVFVPTGYQSRDLIVKAGLKLGSVELLTEMMDITFDGADEVDPFLNCIKGGGACQFQEKLVAINSRKLVVVAGTYLQVPRKYAGHSRAQILSGRISSIGFDLSFRVSLLEVEDRR